MEWTKEFYTKQAEWLGLPAIWDTLSPVPPPDRGVRRALAIERLAGPGTKRVLELGCGSGLVAATIAGLVGHSVVAVDIVDASVASARRVAKEVTNGDLTVVRGSFYEIELQGKFDVVCYFDGFGIGSDADQRRLLRRIAGWLEPTGCAIIDVYTPWDWFQDSGETYREGGAIGRGGFDPEGCRGLNTIWPVGDESQAVTQSLRCYSPADLRLLLEGTGLVLDTFEPYASEEHKDLVPLEHAMFYLTKLLLERALTP
jgi:SAM-dependent methyltransferase